MKKILLMLVVLFSAITANAKCDWSSLKLQQWNERNYYKWQVSGAGIGDDTCVSYQMSIYNFQTGKSQVLKGGKDTGVGFEYYLYERNGFVEVLFNTRGRYKLYVKVTNKCTKCDTALYRVVELIQFPGAGLGYSVNTNDCKKYKFEMTYIKGYPLKDTCMEYYMVFYKGPWMDTMSQKEWDNLTDYQIGMEYDFPDADYLDYTQTRIADYTFKNTGRVLMYAQWWNKCVRQDTFMFRKLDVCKTTTKPRCNWSKLGFGYNNKCNTYVFELGSLDTCISYTTYIYNFKTGRWIDTFKTRIFTKPFADTGKYTIYVIAKNKCGGCDTAYSNFVTVTCQPTSSVKNIVRDEDLRIIGYYDMIGRKVEYMEVDKPYIIIYSNGKRQKVMRSK